MTTLTPALRPELEHLIEVGVLERALTCDGTRGGGGFVAGALAATRRGELTEQQAAALAALLGLELPSAAAA